MSDDKKPLDQAVELVVFAPIGFALEARRLLPSFVERGRAQVNMAKVVGQFAVTTGQAEAAKRMARVQEQAEALLGEFGLAGGATTPPSGASSAPSSAAPAAGSAAPAAAPSSAAATSPVSPVSPAPAAGAPSSGSSRAPVAAGALPISDYDSLAASQVIPRLAGLSEAELDAVEAYERANRGRKTILGKVAQLREA